MAQAVDPQTLAMRGDVFRVAERVSPGYDTGYNLFSVSGNGVLVYETGSRALSLTQHNWFDRSGKQVAAVGRPVQSEGFSLSPDGKRAVIGRNASGPTQADLWMYDLERGTESRFTFDASDNQSPISDGARVAFSSNRGGGVQNLYQKDSNGTGQDELLFQSATNKRANDWSRDGRFIVFSNQDPKTKYDLWALPMTPGNQGDRTPIPLLTSEFSERTGQVSPDSRWLAYASDESGRAEVYVQAFFPGNRAKAGKWQISRGGGTEPRWSPDGKAIYYVGPKGMLTFVAVSDEAGFTTGVSQPLFRIHSRAPISSTDVFTYDVARDGKRLLVNRYAKPDHLPPLTIMLNTTAPPK